jgi:L-alanine-DL-glutamate epimerase-like enolase superfamily enzyme
MTAMRAPTLDGPLFRSPTIARIDTAVVTRPFNPALAVRGARFTHDVSTFVFVRVRTSDGAEGFGEVSATRNWSGEDDITATHMIGDVIAPALIGQPVSPVRELSAVMDRVVAGNCFTKAGVNMALWDALGMSTGLPVSMLLGGPRRDRVPVKISLSGDGDDLRASYAAGRAAGFSAFKVKVGKGLDGDLHRFALARELAGDGTFLGADANAGWSSSEARSAVAALAGLGAAFVEQPVAAGDLAALAALRHDGTLPVVADEAVYGIDDLVQLIRADAADAVSIYIGKSGGLEQAVRMADMCSAFGLDVVIGSNAEFDLGAAAQAHVAAACERLGGIPSDIIGHHFYSDGVLAEPLAIVDGWAHVPAEPGLGVRLRDDILALLR